MKWHMLCTSINFNFKYHEIYIKTSFRTLRSLTFIKMWRVLISPVNSLQMPRNLKAFLLAQFKLRLQKTIPHRKLKNTTIPAFVVSRAFHWPYRLAHKSSFWARSAIVRARSASERARSASERKCRVLPHQTRKPSERLWESLLAVSRQKSEHVICIKRIFFLFR